MTGQISASVEKDFLSTFYLPLPGYPISYQIDNVVMQCELVFKKNILVFGKYDLVFCYPDTVNELEPGYSAASLTRTFCEPILLTGSDILEMLSGGIIDIQAAFGQPLHVWIKLGKPLNLKPWERLKSLLLHKTWVEVVIEGRITAEIARNHRNTDLEIKEFQSHTRACITVEQDDMAIQQKEAAIDLEALAEQVQKIISQRQEEKASKDEAARQEACAERSNAPKPDAIPPGQGEPEVLNTAKVTELVLNILHAREAARASQEQHRSQHPTTSERQGYFNAPRPEATRYPRVSAREPACGWGGVGYPPVPVQMPLEQIPSRPGFEAVFHNPPPKPPGAGG